jgi:septum formation protein
MREDPHHTTVILASASPRRRELLRLLGLSFQTRIAGIDEREDGDPTPAELVARLSREKGRAGARAAEGSIIISSDTIVVLEDQILGKPGSEDEARMMLRALRGREHHVLSAITIIDQIEGVEIADRADTRVHMRDYTEQEIEAYIETGDPMDKAGAYAIQHPGFHPVSHIQGCYAGVMGFPLCHLFRQLTRLGRIALRHPVQPCIEFTGHPCTFHPCVLSAGAEE